MRGVATVFLAAWVIAIIAIVWVGETGQQCARSRKP